MWCVARLSEEGIEPGFRSVHWEPQSTAFFLLLIVVFGGLMWWLAVAKQMVFRILAACLAFIPAMAFGVAAVNKYYDYYQNWNSAISDFTGAGNQAAELPTTDAGAGVKFSTFLGSTIDQAVAAQFGYTVHLKVTGKLSHITRNVYVYLPPQYFQAVLPQLPLPGDRAAARLPRHPAGLDHGRRGHRDDAGASSATAR